MKLGDYFTLDVARRELRGPFRTARADVLLELLAGGRRANDRAEWLARPRGHALSDREATRARRPRHGGDQPPAGLGGGGRDAGRRRQRRRRGDGRAVRAHRRRADDGGNLRRRPRPDPSGRPPAHGDRRLHDRTGRGPSRHLPSRLRLVARLHGSRRSREQRRREIGRRARQPGGLVPDAGPLRHRRPRHRDGPGHPSRRARLPRHRLPRRVPHGGLARPRPVPGQRARVPAQRHAATPGRSAGAGRLRGDPARDRGRGTVAALRRRARPPSRRVHGAGRRPDHARRSRQVPDGRTRAGPRERIAASRSWAARRPPAAAST